jgi:hypothetical protein
MSVRAAKSAAKNPTFASGVDYRSTGPGCPSKKAVCAGPGGAACFGVDSSRRNKRAFSARNCVANAQARQLLHQRKIVHATP